MSGNACFPPDGHIRTNRRVPSAYRDPDVEDAMHLVLASYALQKAGREDAAEETALDAARLMASVPANRDGDRKAGNVSYSRHGILSVSIFGQTVSVPAPPFADGDRDAEGSARRATRKDLKLACRCLRYGWFPTAQVVLAAAGGKTGLGIAPSASLRKLSPLLAAYDPGLPDEALRILAEKAYKALEKSMVGNDNAGPWYYIKTSARVDREPFSDRRRLYPGGQPWPESDKAPYGRFGWFEEDVLDQAVIAAKAVRETAGGTQAPAPRTLCWPLCQAARDSSIFLRAEQEIDKCHPNRTVRYNMDWLLAKTLFAAADTCDLIRLDRALKATGSEYATERLTALHVIGPAPELPDHPCVASGLLACRHLLRNGTGGNIPEGAHGPFLTIARAMLEEFEAAGAFAIDMREAPSDGASGITKE